MRSASLETFAIRLPREMHAVTGTAGSPTALHGSKFDYRWSETYPVLYAVNFEAALFKLTTDTGLVGWGEAQAPLAPEVACTITERLLRPAVEGEPFDGTPERIAELWLRMYSTMRVRGQTGGFMLDAISGVDIALWDVAGKITGQPVATMLASGPLPEKIPAYLSGLSGATNTERVEQARQAWASGFRTFKLFYDRTEDELFDLIDALQAALGPEARIAVDALWRLDESTAIPFGRKCDERSALWLECPLLPELINAHADLAAAIRTPLALGESYRTRYELAPFLDRKIVKWIQPDLGRCGISGAIRWSKQAESIDGAQVVPHISIAMGPQIAAALHLAAAAPNCHLAEYNPSVFNMANRFLTQGLSINGAAYRIPTGPGLGVTINEAELLNVAQRPALQPVQEMRS
jgi:galactonate dehydratase